MEIKNYRVLNLAFSYLKWVVLNPMFDDFKLQYYRSLFRFLVFEMGCTPTV